ncbi:coiled-coil domain-containing protein 97 isoform X2 [Ambystoma mexicanum]|uniref:coiled-coil domain-containing protein 97 isoform X2 n=1 Tax=Ambystoma mexicanum TaxID=8296 RepID=UPI0037E76A0B
MEDPINDEDILVIRAELTSIDSDFPLSPSSEDSHFADDDHPDGVILQPNETTQQTGAFPSANEDLHQIETVQQALKDTRLIDNTDSVGPVDPPNAEPVENGQLTDFVATSASPKDPYEAELSEDGLLMDMLEVIANSKLQIRSQQKDEPDFTQQQKLEMLMEMYRTKPVVFLERFRKALKEEHLECFSHLAGNYEVDFYCQEIRKSSLKKVHRTRVRNKRYAALQELIKGGDYFSDEQMRLRDPLMYEHYVGQYLTEEEIMFINSKEMAEATCLSKVILNSFDEQSLQRRLHRQQEQEDACMEEEEEEDEEELTRAEEEDWVPDGDEKAMLREEFVSRMHQCFLDGKDRDFDYSEVDDNPDFDNLEIVTRDEEERYFDDEEPENIEEMDA